LTNRFFVPSEQIRGSKITICGSDARQIRLVLRLAEGKDVEILDGSGRVYAAKIKSLANDKVVCEAISSRAAKSEPEVETTLIQGVPRESRMDFVIQKCTELGIKRFIPAMSERTIVRLDERKKSARASRWQKIAKEAAEQSGRGIIPRIEEIKTFDDAINDSRNYDLCIIPWEMEEKISLKAILQKNKNAKSVLIAIGPEGGFSKEEVEKAKTAGFISVSLGKRILRTETAGIAVLSMINYEREMK
jgi:16S rRNA (uracil1498-N3)-methyltransferase